ncbi:MAG: hypothetical protein PHH47_03170 [Gallionella sp.]|nr:hypothetical protein [Gallionella sp.]
MFYVYFIVDGGPAALRQGGDWVAILNEVPLTLVFFLAGVFKPYLMVWSRCRKHPSVVRSAAFVMLATTLLAGLVMLLSRQPIAKDLALYINWALLWAASAYYVLLPQQHGGD